MTSREGTEAVRRAEREPRAPGFSLRFEGGRGVLVLARPLPWSLGTIEALDIDLGLLAGPLDLRAGWARFRHRATHALRVLARIELEALLEASTRIGHRVELMHADARRVAVASHDGSRTVVVELVPHAIGGDVLLLPLSARAALEGVEPAWSAVVRLARTLGAPFDETLGAARIEGALVSVLTDALAPLAMRVPDVRRLAMRVSVDGGALVLDARADAPEPAPHVALAAEAARVAAPLLTAASLGDRARAAELARALAEAHPDVELLHAIAADAGLTPPSATRTEAGAEALVLRLRRALAEHAVEEAASAARALAAAEPSAALACEALRAAADLAQRSGDSAIAFDLFGRAHARRPGDVALGLAWARVAGLGEPAIVRDRLAAVRASLRPVRADLAIALADTAERAHDWALASSMWAEALRLSPDEPRALEGVAGAHERAGELVAACERWDVAAERRRVRGEREDEARCLLRAASLASRLGQPEGAEARLASAMERSRDSTTVARATRLLAESLRARGVALEAARADERLVAQASAALPQAAREEIEAGLLAALKAARGEGRSVSARSVLDALVRLGVARERIDALLAELDRGELDEIEAASGSDADRAARARAVAERLRGAGRLGDAARALARAGVLARDMATLRAAVDLAERSGDRDAALDAITRAMDVVGDGPARAALEARLDALRQR